MKNHSLSIVIFGASGDLTQRKLIPALFSLYQKERLPEIRIIGSSRSEFTHQEFKDHLLAGIHKFSPEVFDKRSWEEFSEFIYYQQGNLNEEGDYQKIAELLDKLESSPSNRLYYLGPCSDTDQTPRGGHLARPRIQPRPTGEITGRVEGASDARGFPRTLRGWH